MLAWRMEDEKADPIGGIWRLYAVVVGCDCEVEGVELIVDYLAYIESPGYREDSVDESRYILMMCFGGHFVSLFC